MRTVFCRFFTYRQSHQHQQVLGALKNRFNESVRTYISSVKNKAKFREVHDASRDNIMRSFVFMRCRMHGRYTTWLSGASYMFPDLVSDVTLNL